MALRSLTSKHAIFALFFLLVTVTASMLVNSGSNRTVASLAAVMLADPQASYTLRSTPSSVTSTLITITTQQLTSPANLTAHPNVSLNRAKEDPDAYTCERAEREVKEAHSRRCGSASAVFHTSCWCGIPVNCCVQGKGPATCTCHEWWPKEGPRWLTTGQKGPNGSDCWWC